MIGIGSAAEPTEPPRPPSPLRRPWWLAMWRQHGLGAHIAFLLCGAITVYAAYKRGPLLPAPLVPAVPPAPFFSRHAPVTDYFTGDTPALLARAAGSHASLLFFYAPWDSESQAARLEIERAAHILSGQVDVLAINCWHVAGECRKKIKNITAFPLVIVSLRHGRGVQYSGPLEAGRLVRFVQRVLRPLRRLENAADLALLQAASTTVAAAYTPFVHGRPPAAYFSALRAALLSLEERPGGELAWAVVTNARAAARLRLHHPGGLAVINWNGTTVLKAPTFGVLSADQMRTYVSLRAREMAGWLELPGSKSNTLRLLLSRGAALMVFDRRRPLAPAADLATVTPVRRVWLDYNNCNHSETVSTLVRLQDTIARGLAPKEQQQLALCLQHMQHTADTPDTNTSCPLSASGSQDGQSGQSEEAGQPDSCHRRPRSGDSLFSEFIHPDLGVQEMVRQQRLSSCRGLLLDVQQQQQAVQQQQQQQQQNETLSGDGMAPVNITGRRCTTNRTLGIYLLDSVRHAALARRLGLVGGAAGAVILDSEAESQYVLEGPLSAASLSQFIDDHTAGRLSRSLVSRIAGELVPPAADASGDDSGVSDSGDSDDDSSAGRDSDSGDGRGPVVGSEREPAGGGISEGSTEAEVPPGGEEDRDTPSSAASQCDKDTHCDDLSSCASLSTCDRDVQCDAQSCDRYAQRDGPSPCGGPSLLAPHAAEDGTRHRSVRPLAGPTELTSDTFRRVALNSSEDVVVYFYSDGCGHCTAHYHVFLAAMRLFVNSQLRFARIDGTVNDLRWEFSLESFPTVMYLPARRKSESRVFPEEFPITLGYLLRFILANASASVRHAFFYGQCDAACRATTAYRARRQEALVRRRQLSRVRGALRRYTAELTRLRRALRVVVTAGAGQDDL